MCGRYTSTEELSEFGSRIKFKPLDSVFTPRYNIAPTQQAAVVLRDGENICRLMRWGLIPFWAKDESIGYKMINARAETVAEKPAYRKAFEQRRCLVLADGFYEWKKVDGGKVPHRFVVGNKEPFAFAGLWERWWRPDGEGLQTFTIITTEPNELAREVHNRMPVILAPEHYEKWLDSQFNDVTTLRSMLTPFPASRMKCHAVSPYVSNARNEGPQCIVPV